LINFHNQVFGAFGVFLIIFYVSIFYYLYTGLPLTNYSRNLINQFQFSFFPHFAFVLKASFISYLREYQTSLILNYPKVCLLLTANSFVCFIMKAFHLINQNFHHCILIILLYLYFIIFFFWFII